MRIRIWMIVVATVALCVAWVALFVHHAEFGSNIVAGTNGGIVIWKVDFDQIEALAAEIGATLLAALAVGLWTARRKA
jgi:hypothetical protein